MGLTLTRGHPLRIERPHLVVKAVEPPLPFLDHRGFKRACSIAWYGQLHRPLIRLDRFDTRAITDIAVLGLMTGMRNIPEMMGQFRGQGAFLQPFREALQQSRFAKHLFRRLTALPELLQQRIRFRVWRGPYTLHPL